MSTPEQRGEVACLLCDKRVLRRLSRLARLAPPEGIYATGVEITICDNPDCNKRADELDEQFGRPEQPPEYEGITRLDGLKKQAIAAVHNALADILAMADTPVERRAILEAASANLRGQT